MGNTGRLRVRQDLHPNFEELQGLNEPALQVWTF